MTTKCENKPSMCCPPPSCPAQPSNGRVLRTGTSYISSSWYSPWFFRPTPAYVYRPDPVVLPVATKIEARESSPVAAALGCIALIGLLAVLATGIISQDCHYVGTQCTSPNFWGERVCTPIYNCAW